MMSPRRSAVVVLTWALTCFVVPTGCGGPTNRTGVSGEAQVVRVIDGDTIVVSIGGSDEPIRLIGINTPETVDPRRPEECYGAEASARTKSLLPRGTAVRVERDAELRDRYDRLLAYVRRSSDDLFVNLSLVQDGFARSYPFAPNTAHQSEFSVAERAARSASAGLWGSCPSGQGG